MAFTAVSRTYPLCNAHSKQFKRICRALIVTYPFLLQRLARLELLIPVAHNREHDTEWQADSGAAEMSILLNGNESQRSRICATMTACDAVAQAELKDLQFQLYAHSGLSWLVQIWRGKLRWTPSKRHVRQMVSAARTQAGKDEAEQREINQENEDGDMVVGLACLSWTKLAKMRPGTSMELQTYYSLKTGSLTRWTGDSDTDSCIHDGCQVKAPG